MPAVGLDRAYKKCAPHFLAHSVSPTNPNHEDRHDDQRRIWLVTALMLTGCGALRPHGHGAALTHRHRTVADLYVDDADAWPVLESADDEEEDLDDGVWPQSPPPDIAVHGFEGMLDGQVACPTSRSATSRPPSCLRATPPTHPTSGRVTHRVRRGGLRSVCLSQCRKLAARAWRRALTADRRSAAGELAANLAAHPLDDAITLTVAGVLSAPQFLYHVEQTLAATDGRRWPTGRRRVACRTFCGTACPTRICSPPEMTHRAFRSRSNQARRMLRSPKAWRRWCTHRQWLELDRVHATRATSTHTPCAMPRGL